jgi:hypothetical protein
MLRENQRDTKFYVANYQGKECICGRRKGVEISFCFDCFKMLPKRLKEGLKGALDDEGYHFTWNQAYDYLVMERRVEI